MSKLFGDVPLQLIDISDDGKLRVIPETLALIKEIENPNGVGAMVVAGPYHKGKSYLLNRIAKTNNGFKVGLQTEAETKGLWVLARSIDNLTVLLIDSEGIDAPGNKATIDSRVFALCLLISSVFVYNTMSLIEENSLRHLSFVTSLAEHINPSSEENASVAFPQLLWLVRDFQYWKDLDKKHDGSANLYMESVLSRSIGGSEDNDDIREGLSKIFPLDRRSCYLLPTPAIDTEDLINLPEDEINPKFVKRMSSLVNEVMPSLITAKRKGMTPLKGKGYARLIETCCAAMNEEVEQVTLFIPNIRARFAVNEAEELYERGMEFDAKKLPMPDKELKASHDSRSKAALKLFDSKAYGPTKDSLELELRDKLDKKFDVYKTRNSELRDRAFLGFGSLQTAVVAAVVAFVFASVAELNITLLFAGVLCIAYYLGHFYTITNNAAQGINVGIDLWNEHGKAWADDNPQLMVGLLVALTVLLWWFF